MDFSAWEIYRSVKALGVVTVPTKSTSGSSWDLLRSRATVYLTRPSGSSTMA